MAALARRSLRVQVPNTLALAVSHARFSTTMQKESQRLAGKVAVVTASTEG